MEQKHIGQSFGKATRLAILAMLLALVIVLQLTSSVIHIGPAVLNFSLVPIVIGSIILGPVYGGILGYASGIVVIMAGVTGAEAFTNILLGSGAANALITVATCLIKGIASGVVPAFVYRALAGKNKHVAAVVASASAPVVNTGVFLLGVFAMYKLMSEMAAGNGQSAMYFIFAVLVGTNFLVELAINIVLSPVIYTVSEVVARRRYR